MSSMVHRYVVTGSFYNCTDSSTTKTNHHITSPFLKSWCQKLQYILVLSAVLTANSVTVQILSYCPYSQGKLHNGIVEERHLRKKVLLRYIRNYPNSERTLSLRLSKLWNPKDRRIIPRIALLSPSTTPFESRS